LNGELTNAIFTLIVGIIIGYFIHFLTLREKSIIREFEARKEGKDLYLPLYGCLAQLTDLVIGYVRAQKIGKAQVIVEEGYKYLDSNDALSRYNKVYEDFTKLLGRSRKKGLELFIPPELSIMMEDILGYSTYFYEQQTWDSGIAQRFATKTDSVMSKMEELWGVRRTSLTERLFKVKKWLLDCWGY